MSECGGCGECLVVEVFEGLTEAEAERRKDLLERARAGEADARSVLRTEYGLTGLWDRSRGRIECL